MVFLSTVQVYSDPNRGKFLQKRSVLERYLISLRKRISQEALEKQYIKIKIILK
jgi:hypothetical protein